jgi:class 3 adenylate cyclase
MSHDVEAAWDAPGAFRTVLFTDVEGSTALTQRLGDATAREVLREHERIVREALKSHGGSEVKALGDGFMASFSSATRALECAVAIQKQIETWNTARPEPVEGRSEHIRVRIGLNAGEPIAEAADLFGTAVNLAARIAAQAKGGEILIANVVRELAAGKGFSFADRGETALRGFEQPVRLYEVRWSEESRRGAQAWARFSHLSGSAAKWIDDRKIFASMLVLFLALALAFPTGGVIGAFFRDSPEISISDPKPLAELGTGAVLTECQFTNRRVGLRISTSETPLILGDQVTLSADMLWSDPALDTSKLQYFFEMRSMLGDIDVTGWLSSGERLFVPKHTGKLTLVVLLRDENHFIVGCESVSLEVI